MRKQFGNNIKLGSFVMAGLLFLILLLYMIGRNKSLFGPTFVLRARFENVQGLMAGNNVRYAGIEVGTVKKINILNDTLIEVVMMVDDKMKKIIRNSSIASIGTEGLMGNKVINISPSGKGGSLVGEGDILLSRKAVDMDEIFSTFNKTNNDVAVIAENLKSTVMRINNSAALWKLLNDNTLPQNIRSSAANIQLATAQSAEMIKDLQALLSDVKKGKGALGTVLTDSSFSKNLNEALDKIRLTATHADEFATTLTSTVADIQQQMNNGKGTVNALLKDSLMVVKLNNSLSNIEKGTEGFNQNMEALKHNFLFRGYFKKLEKKKQ